MAETKGLGESAMEAKAREETEEATDMKDRTERFDMLEGQRRVEELKSLRSPQVVADV